MSLLKILYDMIDEGVDVSIEKGFHSDTLIITLKTAIGNRRFSRQIYLSNRTVLNEDINAVRHRVDEAYQSFQRMRDVCTSSQK